MQKKTTTCVAVFFFCEGVFFSGTFIPDGGFACKSGQSIEIYRTKRHGIAEKDKFVYNMKKIYRTKSWNRNKNIQNEKNGDGIL